MRVFVVMARRPLTDPYVLAIYANPLHADADAGRWAGRDDGRRAWVESYYVVNGTPVLDPDPADEHQPESLRARLLAAGIDPSC